MNDSDGSEFADAFYISDAGSDDGSDGAFEQQQQQQQQQQQLLQQQQPAAPDASLGAIPAAAFTAAAAAAAPEQVPADSHSSPVSMATPPSPPHRSPSSPPPAAPVGAASAPAAASAAAPVVDPLPEAAPAVDPMEEDTPPLLPTPPSQGGRQVLPCAAAPSPELHANIALPPAAPAPELPPPRPSPAPASPRKAGASAAPAGGNVEPWRGTIAGFPVAFPPGRTPFGAQRSVMASLLRAMRDRQHALLESPTGTGKTLAIICAVLAFHGSYQGASPPAADTPLSTPASAAQQLARRAPAMALQPVTLQYEEDKIEVGKVEVGNVEVRPPATPLQAAVFSAAAAATAAAATATKAANRAVAAAAAATQALRAVAGGHAPPHPVRCCSAGSADSGGCGGGGVATAVEQRGEEGDSDGEAVAGGEVRQVRAPSRVFYCTRTHSQLTQVVTQLRLCEPLLDLTTVQHMAATGATAPPPTATAATTPPRPAAGAAAFGTAAAAAKQLGGSAFQYGSPLEGGSARSTPDCHSAAAAAAAASGVVAASGFKMALLAARKHTCIHDGAWQQEDVTAACKVARDTLDCKRRSKAELLAERLPRVWDLEDSKVCGKETGGCPYYAAKEALKGATLCLCPYNYIIDPAIRKAMGVGMDNAVIIFDEAHNIASFCREAATLEVSRSVLFAAEQDMRRVLRLKRLPEDPLDGDAAAAIQRACRSLIGPVEGLRRWLDGDVSDLLRRTTPDLRTEAERTFGGERAVDVLTQHAFMTGDRLWGLEADLDSILRKVEGAASVAADERGGDAQAGGGDTRRRGDSAGNNAAPADTADAAASPPRPPRLTPRKRRGPAIVSRGDSSDSDDADYSIDHGGDSLVPLQDGGGGADSAAAGGGGDAGAGGRGGGRRRRERVRKLSDFLLRSTTLSLLSRLLVVGRFVLGAGTRDNGSTDATNAEHYRLCVRRTAPPGQRTHEIWAHLWCLSGAVAFKDIARRSRCVVLASGTLCPLNAFSGELGTPFPIQLEAKHVVDTAQQCWVGAVGAWDQGAMGGGGGGGRLELLGNAAMQRRDEYRDAVGAALLRYCAEVDGGLLCFFPSYWLLAAMVQHWKITGVWQQLQARTMVECEPSGASGAAFQLVHERVITAIDSNGNALLLAVFRGKVSEGIDFPDRLCRLVLCVGVPHAALDTLCREKMSYQDSINAKHQRLLQQRQQGEAQPALEHLSGREWYEQCAFRALNQAFGRCIRHRKDHGAIVLLDCRYQREANRRHLSSWARSRLRCFNTVGASLPGLRAFYSRQPSVLASLDAQDLEAALRRATALRQPPGSAPPLRLPAAGSTEKGKCYL